MKKSLLAVLAFPLIFSMVALASPTTQDNRPTGVLSQKSIDRIYKEVRHELVMLPYYGVFDNLSYKVDSDGTVTLLGQVARPTLKRCCPPPSTTTKSAVLPTAPSTATKS
jgi:hyperosmotically inducible protein